MSYVFNPFFSIIIPTYNRAEFLTHTIDSISKQVYNDYELIIVDDGSEDNTKEVVLKLATKNQRIRYIFQDNAERGAARNNGIKNSNGQYIIFFDSDDEMMPHYLQVLSKNIQEQLSYNFYAIKYNFIRKGKPYDSSVANFRQKEYGLDLLLEGNPFACNFCIKKNNPSLRLFQEDRSLATTEDWMFLLENLQTDHIYFIEKLCLSMHQHDGRSMQQNRMLIKRRLSATENLCLRLKMDKLQKTILWAYSYYFCSIHAYLDFNRVQAFGYLQKATNLLGWNKLFAFAFIKFIIGKQLISKFQRIFLLRL
jgi:GalNAc5-diNAcBac-PP-undecaprenol beta-1,3-glucosyltransferase